MKSVSVLGCGWLGLPLAKHLKQSGWKVSGSSRKDNRLRELEAVGIEPFKIDLEQPDKMGSAFFDSEILILNIPPRSSKISHIDMLKSLKEQVAQSRIKWVLYISSIGIYPNLRREVTESDASAVAASKGGVILHEAENVWAQQSAFDCTIIRFGGLYGPNREPAGFFQGKEHIPGGLNPVNMIHLHDCIGSIEATLDKGLKNEIFSVCAPDHPSRTEFYGAAARKAQMPPPNFLKNKTDWKIVDPGKFIRQSGYAFRH